MRTDLTRFLRQHTEGIIAQFVAAVYVETAIESSDELEKDVVIDHMRDLLGSLAEDLLATEGRPRPVKTANYAKAHGQHRWEQYYRIDELLREYAILRRILMFWFEKFEKDQPFEIEDRLSASRILHDLIDEVMILSAGEFTEQVAQAGHVRKEKPGALEDIS